jgi:DNA-binding NarL/FixJ family response regulator
MEVHWTPGYTGSERKAFLTNVVSTNGIYEQGRPVLAVKAISICDTQPVTAEGIRTLLNGCADLRFRESSDSLGQALDQFRRNPPDVLMIDKAFGIQAILEWLSETQRELPPDVPAGGNVRPGDVRPGDVRPGVVVWGVSVTEAEALRFLQSGARGILRKTAGTSVVLACLRAVAGGRSWMEDCVFRDSKGSERYPRSELTGREQQVLELVEQGFKNKEIAHELGIRPGSRFI